MAECLHNLNRFVTAQNEAYERVVRELKNGKKITHWMWYIFPQIAGLGYSSTAQFFAIQNRDETQAYLAHPILGGRILECTDIVLAHLGKTAVDIFGDVDAMKFRSSMTLFMSIAGSDLVFQDAIEEYFEGKPDPKTLDILSKM